MIQHVYERASKSEAEAVYVATDDERIRAVVREFSDNVIMTSKDHETGTDRIHEAAVIAGLSNTDVVVNVQGDEPLMPPAAINQVARAISDSVEMATLKEKISELSDVFDPNVVKVVTDDDDLALYFSRAPVPWARDDFGESSSQMPTAQLWYRHLGIYAYTVGLLKRYVSWPVGDLEKTEKLEQLRVLTNGEKIKVLSSVQEIPPGIDVPEDIARTLQALDSIGEN